MLEKWVIRSEIYTAIQHIIEKNDVIQKTR